MNMPRLPIYAAAFALALGMAWAPAQAQQAPQQQQQMNFSDDDLRSYALAALQVRDISRDFQPRLEEAETPEEQNTVREEAMEEMVSAVQEQGLSVQDYNTIYQAAQSDQQIAEKVSQYMQDAQ